MLHRTITEALESLAPTSALREACLADLAAHCYAAELWEKAMAYGQLVGEKAMALDAPRAAVAHMTEALGAAHQLLMTPPAILHQVRGQGYDTLGEFERAQADYEQALHLAHLSGDCLYERSVELLRASGDHRALSSSLSVLCAFVSPCHVLSVSFPRKNMVTPKKSLLRKERQPLSWQKRAKLLDE